MRIKKDSKGFSHHLLLPVLAIFAVGAIGVFTMSMSSAATAKSCRERMFKRGASSVCVKYAAQMMNATSGTGADVTKVDSVFGPQTYAKTIRFQKKKNLSADGIIGPKTWGKLCSANYSGRAAAQAKESACVKKTARLAADKTKSKKDQCNEKAGMKWANNSCQNLRKVCVNNNGTWNEKKKTCTIKKEKKAIFKQSCIPGYVNREDTGACVKIGSNCAKPPFALGAWQKDGTCKGR